MSEEPKQNPFIHRQGDMLLEMMKNNFRDAIERGVEVTVKPSSGNRESFFAEIQEWLLFEGYDAKKVSAFINKIRAQ